MTWTMRYAPHLGLTSPDTPLFRHMVGSADPVEQIRFSADQGFAGIEDNFLKLRPAAEQERMGAALARAGLEMGCFVNNVESWN
jgi:hydroxypyruvate isomerase